MSRQGPAQEGLPKNEVQQDGHGKYEVVYVDNEEDEEDDDEWWVPCEEQE